MHLSSELPAEVWFEGQCLVLSGQARGERRATLPILSVGRGQMSLTSVFWPSFPRFFLSLVPAFGLRGARTFHLAPMDPRPRCCCPRPDTGAKAANIPPGAPILARDGWLVAAFSFNTTTFFTGLTHLDANTSYWRLGPDLWPWLACHFSTGRPLSVPLGASRHLARRRRLARPRPDRGIHAFLLERIALSVTDWASRVRASQALAACL